MKYRKSGLARIETGKCVACGVALDVDSTQRYCRTCADRMAERGAKRREWRKANRMCTDCGKSLSLDCETFTCSECLARASQRRKSYLMKAAAQGKCFRCGGKEPIVEAAAKYAVCETCYLKGTAAKAMGNVKLWGILKEKLVAQNYRCAYTGVPLVLGVNDSVDHILPRSRFPELVGDPTNIEWTTGQVNLAKRDLTRDEFLELVKQIVRYCELSILSDGYRPPDESDVDAPYTLAELKRTSGSFSSRRGRWRR